MSILISPKLPFYELLLASLVAIFSKNFIKGANRHVFNPAGIGALTSSFIFGNPVSWWASSFQPLISLYFLLLLCPFLVSMVRLKRFPITIPFLLIYSLLIFLFNKVNPATGLTDPTVVFFSLVMLPEPQTTPNRPVTQILFGSFVALASIGFSKFALNVDPLILSLLTGNLLFYRLK